MNKKIFIALGAIVAAGSILAAPGGFHGGGPRGSGGFHGGRRAPMHHVGGRPRHAGPGGGGFCSPAPRGPAPRVGGFRSHAPHGPLPPRMSGGFRSPAIHRPPPPRVGGFHGPFRPGYCGFRYPRGHHIGGRHIAIVPPVVLINDYYWTEEIYINGCYYVLYCYPDGTKRFADGTIYSYF